MMIDILTAIQALGSLAALEPRARQKRVMVGTSW